MSETTQKGAVAEAAIALEATKLGFVVSRPMAEGRRYDLIIDVDHRLYRVQCKWARREGAVLVINLESCRHTPQGYVRTKYHRTEIDAVAAYSQELQRCHWLPIEVVEGMRSISLRLSPAANNQQTAINFAADYAFGAIAQLGERVTGSHEVAGSSPASSTLARPS